MHSYKNQIKLTYEMKNTMFESERIVYGSSKPNGLNKTYVSQGDKPLQEMLR